VKTVAEMVGAAMARKYIGLVSVNGPNKAVKRAGKKIAKAAVPHVRAKVRMK
jgi:hypothetical protein